MVGASASSTSTTTLGRREHRRRSAGPPGVPRLPSTISLPCCFRAGGVGRTGVCAQQHRSMSYCHSRPPSVAHDEHHSRRRKIPGAGAGKDQARASADAAPVRGAGRHRPAGHPGRSTVRGRGTGGRRHHRLPGRCTCRQAGRRHPSTLHGDRATRCVLRGKTCQRPPGRGRPVRPDRSDRHGYPTDHP